MLQLKQSQKSSHPVQSAIDLTKSSSKPTQQKTSKKWISNDLYTLSAAAKGRVISLTAWLSDDIIHAAQMLMREKSPFVGGLQPPCRGQNCSFDVEGGEFIQILHNGYDHWLTVSTVGVAESAVVRVYDSLYPHLTTKTQQQIAAIINTPKPKIQLELIDVQNQSGSNDCGAFAIAFATALIFGEEPGKLIFAEAELRKTRSVPSSEEKTSCKSEESGQNRSVL